MPLRLQLLQAGWVERKLLSFHTGGNMIRDFLLLILCFIMVGIWATAWLAFHVAGGMIHLLLLVALVLLIAHLFRGRSVA